MQQNRTHSVLIVEDDPESNDNLRSLLSQTFENVISVYDGAEGLKAYRLYRPDIVITDIEMPGMNGLDLVRAIRKVDPNCFVGILTSYSNQHYLMQAVSLKLDTYILKPLTSAKLDALVNDIRRFRQQFIHHRLPIHQDAYYDSKAKIVVDGGRRIFLTHSEITLLELFLYYRGEALLYDTIEYALYGTGERSRNAMKILISNLRKKIPALSIRSIPKIGYILS
ncbi:MAG: response regulator [Campylobacterales bacterium]|nr:response regulator [Campylobacterales bacterium]